MNGNSDEIENLRDILTNWLETNQNEDHNNTVVEMQQTIEGVKLELNFRKEKLTATTTELDKVKMENLSQQNEIEDLKKENAELNNKLKSTTNFCETLKNKLKSGTDTITKSNLAMEFETKVKENSSLKEYITKLQTQICELERKKEDLELKNTCAEHSFKTYKEQHILMLNRMQKIKEQIPHSSEKKIDELRKRVIEGMKKCDQLSNISKIVEELKTKMALLQGQFISVKAKNNIYEQFLKNFEMFYPQKEAEMLLKQWKAVLKTDETYEGLQETIDNLLAVIKNKEEIISMYMKKIVRMKQATQKNVVVPPATPANETLAVASGSIPLPSSDSGVPDIK